MTTVEVTEKSQMTKGKRRNNNQRQPSISKKMPQNTTTVKVESKPQFRKSRVARQAEQKVVTHLAGNFRSVKPVNHPLKHGSRSGSTALRNDFQKYSKALALPGITRCPRWSTQYDDTPTATVSLQEAMPVPQNTTNETASSIFASKYSFAVVRRTLECAKIIYYAPVTATVCTYTFYGSVQSDEFGMVPPSTSWYLLQAIPLPGGNHEFPVGWRYGLASTTYQPHGAMWFAGALRDDTLGDRFFWLDQGMKLSLNFSASTTGTLGDISGILDLWTKGGIKQDVLVQNSSVLSGTLTFVIANSGYYRLRLMLNVAAEGNVDLSVSSITYTNNAADAPAIFGHQAIVGYANNFSSVNSFRVIGAALMYTNSSPEIEKQGMVAGYQIPAGEHWTEFVTSDPYAHLTGMGPKCDRRTATNGIYGFVKPASDEDWQFRTHTTWSEGVLLDSFWPINDKILSSLVIVSSIPAFAGRVAEYNFYFSVEYQTTDQWKNPQNAPLDNEIAKEALVHIRTVPQFSENPLHIGKIWGDIKNIAKNVVNGIVKYAPKVISTAEAIGGLLA